MTSHTPRTLSRRTALAAVAGGAALALPGHAAARQSRDARPATDPLAALAFDRATGRYVLPDLPYDYDALEPHIDAQTMRIHHTKHHAGYVRGLNSALQRLADIRENNADPGNVRRFTQALAFHGGGHRNHTVFWYTMAPAEAGGGGEPAGTLADAINDAFGAYERFRWQMTEAAATVRGSGWAWLAWEPIARRLVVLQMEQQQDVLMPGVTPLLGVDVWEHAYYLRYQNRRRDYIDAWFNVINWPYVGRLFEAARRA